METKDPTWQSNENKKQKTIPSEPVNWDFLWLRRHVFLPGSAEVVFCQFHCKKRQESKSYYIVFFNSPRLVQYFYNNLLRKISLNQEFYFWCTQLSSIFFFLNTWTFILKNHPFIAVNGISFISLSELLFRQGNITLLNKFVSKLK